MLATMRQTWVALGMAAAIAGACQPLTAGAPPEPLAWRLDPAFSVAADSRSLHVLVEVPICPQGASEVSSAVQYGPEEIAVSMRRPGLPPGVGRCLLGPTIYGLEVDLSEPVGKRRIVSLDEPAPSFIRYTWVPYPGWTPAIEYPSAAP
jgi:hypothetical protein